MSARRPRQMRSFHAQDSAARNPLAVEASQKSVGNGTAHSSRCGIVRLDPSATPAHEPALANSIAASVAAKAFRMSDSPKPTDRSSGLQQENPQDHCAPMASDGSALETPTESLSTARV